MGELISLKEELVSPLVEGLTTTGVWTSLEVLGLPEVEAIVAHARQAFSGARFRRAQVGKGAEQRLADSVRRDQILWIEDWSDPVFAPYARFLNDLKNICRQELYLPIKRWEGHLAHYEAGAFYERHRDRHQSRTAQSRTAESHRWISVLLYLNDVPEDSGGALTLYHQDGSVLTKIQPRKGLVVVFQSETEHEVHITQTARWSLTAWLRDDE